MRYGLALLSGGLLALCFPGPDQGWLVWIALVPLFLALQSADSPWGVVSPGCGARLGFVTGAMFLGTLLYWIWVFGWYAWLALTIIDAAWIALFGALAAALLRRAPSRLVMPTLAAAWTVVEWLRGQGVLGFTWGDLAVSQHRTLPVLQMLDWTGPFGLTFLIALVNASLAGVILGWRLKWRDQAATPALTPVPSPENYREKGDQPKRQDRVPLLSAVFGRGRVPAQRVAGVRAAERWLFGAAGIVALLTARGAWLLSRPLPAGSATLPVAVVQGNIRQDVDWDDDYKQRAIEAHFRLTQAAAQSGARLVIWSETAVPGELRSDPTLNAAITGLARTTGTELIVGSNDHMGTRDYNRAFLIDRLGHVRGHYAKRQLVPYGESVPLHAMLPILDFLHVRPVDLTPGDGYYPMHGGHNFGTIICFESAFPAITRAMALHGAELLIEITNDTWFGRSAAAEQHAAMAPLRAVETRRALARATATGISTLVDDHGRIRKRLGLFRQGYLLDTLPVSRDLTLYTRLGDWPVWLSFLICLIGPIRRIRPTKQQIMDSGGADGLAPRDQG